MRVLFITNFFPPRYWGGAEVAAFYSCYGLRQRGITCQVLSISARFPEAFDQEHEFHGISVQEVGYPFHAVPQLLRVFDARIYRRTVREIEKFKPDLVHTHNISGTSLAPFVACCRLGVPVVATLHDHWLLCPNNMLFRRDHTLCNPARYRRGCGQCYRRYDYWGAIPGRRFIFAQLVRNVRTFIAPSRKLADLHVAAGYDPTRFRVLKYGIAPQLLRRRTASPPPLNHHQNTVLFSGAVVETKGVNVLSQALPILSKHVDHFHLSVAGSGDQVYVDALRAAGPGTVTLWGKLPFDRLGGLYATAGLTVVPSIWYDNSPMVIYESLLVGTPVVGSAIGGIPELIREGETGYLVPPGDPAALAEKIILHFARPARERRAMRHRCMAYAEAHLTLEHHLTDLLSIYQEAVQR